MSSDTFSLNLPGTDSWADLLRPAGWTLGIQVAGASLGYGLHVLIGRWLGADVYGTYLLAMGGAVLLARLAGLGLPTAVLRLIPEYDTNREYGLMRGLLRSSRGFVLGAGVLASLSMTVGLFTFSLFPNVPLSALLVGVWLAPILALVGLETEVLRARRHVVWAYAPPRILRPLLLIAGIGVLVFSPLPNSASLLLGLSGGLLALTFLLQYVGTRRVFPRASQTAAPSYTPRSWLHLAAPLFLIKGFLTIMAKTDIFVLGAFFAPKHVGLYGAAFQTAHTITFVGAALDSVASSAVSRLHTQGDRAGLQSLSARLAHLYFWPTLLLAGGVAVGAPFILRLFGTAFEASRPGLLILMGGLLVNASTGCQEYLLTLTGHQRACARVYGTAMVLNLGLNVLLVPMLSTIGAALATASTMAFCNGWMYILVTQRLNVDPTICAWFLSSRPAG